ncbi:MAG: argininosuccinate lyase [Rikenellaceae bacterium]
MMTKLWQKDKEVDASVDAFTVGRDREMDMMLAKSDVIGSLAHTKMLSSIGLLTQKELTDIHRALKNIYKEIEQGVFQIDTSSEDIHSYIELRLTQEIGEAGAKIHSGRSRNDQVLVDIKLFLREELWSVTQLMKELFETLQVLSDRYKKVLIPGYTHLQVAMPSSFGLWFGAFAESLTDDLRILKSAYDISNRNPLGSAAGYGSSFPLNRSYTTELMGFEGLNYNVVYAQMGRGKSEKIASFALASVATTLSRLAMDNCMFMCQNFGFVSYPDEFTTGSSIMPHKKNPDVWELVRGKCNLLQALPNTISMLTINLPQGYNRDLQLLKEHIFPAFSELKSCLTMSKTMLEHIVVKENVVSEGRYDYLFSVEQVNKMVLEGVPFRKAYKSVGRVIENGSYTPIRDLNHTHEGSIGNLCNNEIQDVFMSLLSSFNHEKVVCKLEKLVR